MWFLEDEGRAESAKAKREVDEADDRGGAPYFLIGQGSSSPDQSQQRISSVASLESSSNPVPSHLLHLSSTPQCYCIRMGQRVFYSPVIDMTACSVVSRYESQSILDGSVYFEHKLWLSESQLAVPTLPMRDDHLDRRIHMLIHRKEKPRASPCFLDCLCRSSVHQHPWASYRVSWRRLSSPRRRLNSRAGTLPSLVGTQPAHSDMPCRGREAIGPYLLQSQAICQGFDGRPKAHVDQAFPSPISGRGFPGNPVFWSSLDASMCCLPIRPEQLPVSLAAETRRRLGHYSLFREAKIFICGAFRLPLAHTPCYTAILSAQPMSPALSSLRIHSAMRSPSAIYVLLASYTLQHVAWGQQR
ncbi:hypothetical protein ACRALDRAFT_213013 [Sodiomyces alcalophilus JCM 7366]|uniref:uncharacterized protein n=1 Tax=Sodiomyces alcalophilus JCM 7366 TaxID=591952 RepID=UPI0039B6A383